MTKLIISLFIVLTATISSSYANLVSDGGFEGLTGYYYNTGLLGAWTLNTPSYSPGVYSAGMFSLANVTEGNNAFDMGMGSWPTGNSISQTLPTIAGKTYSLSFDWGSEYGWGTDSIVTVGNLSVPLIEDPINADNYITTEYGFSGWYPYAGVWIDHSSVFSFTANGNDVLTFIDNSAVHPMSYGGLSLDNIVVEESMPVVPEPVSSILFVTGGATLIGRKYIRRKKIEI